MRSQIALINMHLQSYFVFKSVKTTQKWKKKNSCLSYHASLHRMEADIFSFTDCIYIKQEWIDPCSSAAINVYIYIMLLLPLSHTLFIIYNCVSVSLILHSSPPRLSPHLYHLLSFSSFSLSSRLAC